MPQYLLSLSNPTEQPNRQRTDEEMRHSMSDILALNDALKSAVPGSMAVSWTLPPPRKSSGHGTARFG